MTDGEKRRFMLIGKTARKRKRENRRFFKARKSGFAVQGFYAVGSLFPFTLHTNDAGQKVQPGSIFEAAPK